ncbi:MAG: hypothetical protein ACRDWE_02725, partial [Acidimicrobiales bacterium]
MTFSSPSSSPHRTRTLPLVLALLLALGLLVGCGSAAATHSATARAATGAGGDLSATPPATASCATKVASTLGEVATRVYHEAATGGDVAEAVHRVQSSTALADAIDSDNASATRAALEALLLDQIVRVEILRDGHVLAQAGSGAAIAPVRGSIPGTSGSFVLSTQSDRTYLQVVHQITGAQVLLTSGPSGGVPHGRRLAGTIGASLPASAPGAGPLTLAGRDYQSFTLAGAVYPSGPLRITLLVP